MENINNEKGYWKKHKNQPDKYRQITLKSIQQNRPHSRCYELMQKIQAVRNSPQEKQRLQYQYLF